MLRDTEEFVTPGQLIRALLEARNWTQILLAEVLGVTQPAINKLATDARPVDALMALRLSEVFGVPPEQFLDLQKSLDLARAKLVARPDPGRATRAQLLASLPVAEMVDRAWLDVDSVQNLDQVETALTKFFGVETPDQIEILPHATKKTNVSSDVTPAQLAWIYRVTRIAGGMIVSRYSLTAARRAIRELSLLLLSREEVRKVPRILAENGIRFVIVESLSSAKIDGVCFWLNDKSPVIGMSLRYDRIDNFWFVLRHELEHILKGHGRSTIALDAELEMERAGTGLDLPKEEREANQAAADFCVPANKLQQFLTRKAPMFYDIDIRGFARTLGVHPGLVAGQLQHHLGRYDRFRSHLVKIKSAVVPSAVVDGWGDVAPVEF